jgi:hypothetical protein
MTKRNLLIKVAISDTVKFTGLGIGVGSLPGIFELARAQAIKDKKERKKARSDGFKRLGMGLPIGGTIGYGLGKGVELVHSTNTLTEKLNKAVDNASRIDPDKINNLSENIKDLTSKWSPENLKNTFTGPLARVITGKRK